MAVHPPEQKSVRVARQLAIVFAGIMAVWTISVAAVIHNWSIASWDLGIALVAALIPVVLDAGYTVIGRNLLVLALNGTLLLFAGLFGERAGTHYCFLPATALPFALSLRAGAQANEPLKVGFIYVSPIGDAGWTHQHDIARLAMEKNLAGKVTTKYVENVPEGADAERVIRELAQKGDGLIFTTSFGFMNPTLKVAAQFPNVKFEHATGYKTAANVGTYNARFYEGRYLA